MNQIFLTRMDLNPRCQQVRRDLSNQQELHRTISQAFPPLENGGGLKHHQAKAPRSEYNILHRLEIDGKRGRAVLLVQSGIEPNWEHLPVDYAERAECKQVDDLYSHIREGSRLVFRVHANPTKRIGKTFEEDERYQRLDRDKQEEFARRYRDDKTRRRVSLQTEEARVGWLVRKGKDCGFTITDVQVKTGVPNLTTSIIGKINAYREKGKPPMTFGAVTFDGVLEVTDGDRFRDTLVKGIGTGKAYGFGLLSVAPVRG